QQRERRAGHQQGDPDRPDHPGVQLQEGLLAECAQGIPHGWLPSTKSSRPPIPWNPAAPPWKAPAPEVLGTVAEPPGDVAAFLHVYGGAAGPCWMLCSGTSEIVLPLGSFTVNSTMRTL